MYLSNTKKRRSKLFQWEGVLFSRSEFDTSNLFRYLFLILTIAESGLSMSSSLGFDAIQLVVDPEMGYTSNSIIEFKIGVKVIF